MSNPSGDRGEGEIADYTAAIELPGAPVGQVAPALYNRGVAKGERGDNEGAIADYTAAIELPGVQPEIVETAHQSRKILKGSTDPDDGENLT